MELNPGDVILTSVFELVREMPEAVFHFDESSETHFGPSLAFFVTEDSEDPLLIRTLMSFESFCGMFNVFAITVGVKC